MKLIVHVFLLLSSFAFVACIMAMLMLLLINELSSAAGFGLMGITWFTLLVIGSRINGTIN